MRTLARRLLVAGFGGGFTLPEDAMSADETAFWSDMAALLDPDAYEAVVGTSLTRTVPAASTSMT